MTTIKEKKKTFDLLPKAIYAPDGDVAYLKIEFPKDLRNYIYILYEAQNGVVRHEWGFSEDQAAGRMLEWLEFNKIKTAVDELHQTGGTK